MTDEDARGYVRIVTNPERGLRAVRAPGALRGAVDYLDGVLARDACPFMLFTLEENGYRARTDGRPDMMQAKGSMYPRLSRILADAILEFKDQSAPVDGRDPTVVLVSLPHPSNATEEAGHDAAAFHLRYREAVFRQGLMFEIMHPYRGTSPFVAGTPFLTLRRMHRADARFMDTEGAKRAYAQTFGL